MRIGYDGKRAFNNFTGLGNYSRYILSLVSRNFPSIENIIYTPSQPEKKRHEEISKFPQNQIKVAKAIFKSFWRTYGLRKDIKRDKLDIYHGLSNELPHGILMLHTAFVVTIHDIIFMFYPQYYSWIDRKIYEAKTRHACSNADRIITVSEQTKKDLIDYLDLPDFMIHVVYQDCGEVFKRLVSEDRKKALKEKYHLPERFILNVGTIEERKNLILIVEALTLVDQSINLVVVGKEKRYAKTIKKFIRQYGLTDRVHFLKNVSYEDLPGIYQQAEIFVYPSRYEGFGIPIIEALYSQVPVIAATGSCLEEAGGEGSLYTDPDDFEQLAELIQLVLDNPDKRRQMIEAGNQHLRKFDDKVISKKLMNVYHEAIDEFNKVPR